MKLKRIISGAVLLAFVAIILIFGNQLTINLAVSAIAIIAINEYFNSFKEKHNVDRWVGNILAISIAFVDKIPVELIILAIPTIIAVLFMKVIATGMKTNYVDIAISGFGIIYIIGFIVFLPMIFSIQNGRLLIWYLAISAWGTDTFAYLIGIKFGKHKLTKISPKKSVEGFIAGVIGAVLLALIYTYFINKFGNLSISYLAITGIIILLSMLAQIGDLSASSIKRYAGIKDFSNLIPGHGGMLDRIDSILFIAPFSYFLLTLI